MLNRKEAWGAEFSFRPNCKDYVHIYIFFLALVGYFNAWDYWSTSTMIAAEDGRQPLDTQPLPLSAPLDNTIVCRKRHFC